MGRLVLLAVFVFVGCSETSGAGGGGGSAGMGGDDTGDGGNGGDGTVIECRTEGDCGPRRGDCTVVTCTDGACNYLVREDDSPCNPSKPCTLDGVCRAGTCDAEPELDGVGCGNGGSCRSGSCVATFPCTEDGVREAIRLGGGPHTFECDGPTTLDGFDFSLNLERDVILDGEHNLIFEDTIRVAEGVAAGLRRLTVQNTRNLFVSNGSLDLVEVTLDGLACGEKDFIASAVYSQGGRVTISDSVISNGRGGCIGAASSIGGELTVTRTTIRNNGIGAGVYMSLGNVVIQESTVSGHDVGIALCLFAGDESDTAHMQITGSTVSDVVTAVAFEGTTAMITASTLDGDEALGEFPLSSAAASLFCPSGAHDGVASVRNSILSGACGVPVESDGGNIESEGDTCGFDQAGDRANVSADDLKLGQLADNGGPTTTRALGAGSVAIDVIPAEDCVHADGQPLTTDQRGEPRPVGDGCDVGAFEAQPSQP